MSNITLSVSRRIYKLIFVIMHAKNTPGFQDLKAGILLNLYRILMVCSMICAFLNCVNSYITESLNQTLSCKICLTVLVL
jgi:hypothetical protein